MLMKKDREMKMTEELVSVVMPTYNDKMEYLMQAIDSIINQSYKKIELIIVDSSTNDIVKNYINELNNTKIVYYFQKKSGIGAALNFGIKNAKGKFIARMDGDDISDKFRIEKQVDFLNHHKGIDVLGCAYGVIDSDNNKIETRNLVTTHGEISAKLIFGNPIAHPSVIFRRKIFEDGFEYNNVLSEDYDLWTRLILNYRFANLSETLLLYRVHGENLSVMEEENGSKSDSKSAKKYVEKLTSCNLDEYEEQCFVKNYHCLFLEKHIRTNKIEYFVKQIKLLKILYEYSCNSNFDMKNYLLSAIRERLNLICNLISIVDNSLYIFLFEQDILKGDIDLVKLVKLLEKNESKIKSLIHEKKKFYLYGLGKRGVETVKYLEKNSDYIRWEFQGIIDQRRLKYTFNGIERETIFPTENLQCDYIVIAVKEYYYEIREELLKKNYSKEKIINDSFLYYL